MSRRSKILLFLSTFVVVVCVALTAFYIINIRNRPKTYTSTNIVENVTIWISDSKVQKRARVRKEKALEAGRLIAWRSLDDIDVSLVSSPRENIGIINKFQDKPLFGVSFYSTDTRHATLEIFLSDEFLNGSSELKKESEKQINTFVLDTMKYFSPNKDRNLEDLLPEWQHKLEGEYRIIELL